MDTLKRMKSIELTYDPGKQLYSVPALFFISDPSPGMIQVKRGRTDSIFHHTLLYIDTGSNRTTLTDLETEALGINLRNLPTELTGGVGAMSHQPYIDQVTFVLQGKDSQFCQFTLKKVSVVSSKPKTEKIKGKGKKQIITNTGEFFPLLGVDAFIEIGAELFLNPSRETGQIRYP